MRAHPNDTLPLRAGCEPACPGCRHRQWTEAASLAQKAAYLGRTLAPWADVVAPVASVHGAARWGYRERVTLHAVHDGARWRFGLGLRDDFLPIEACPVQSARVGRLLAAAAELLPDPDRLPLAYWVQSGDLLTLVLRTREAPDTAWVPALADALAAEGMRGLWLHGNPSAGRQLFLKTGWTLAWGEARARDALGLVHGPASFQQLVPSLHRAALDAAEAFLAPGPGDTVVDLYCGHGASLARWTARGARALGVELAGEAVATAALNAPDATVLRGACATRLPQLAAAVDALDRPPLAYVNPPRSGLEPEVAAWLAERARPTRLAYLSCSAGTLARDLARLTDAGFTVVSVLPYDFFPQTHHVEALALLARASVSS